MQRLSLHPLIFSWAILLPIAVSLAILIFSVSLDRPLLSTAGLTLFCLSLFWPSLSLGILGLFILPIFGGHYAATDQNAAFEILYSALITGLGIRWLYALFRSGSVVDFKWGQPVGLFFGLFVFSAWASLLALPVDEVWTRFQQIQISPAWAFVHLKETLTIYPFLKALQLSQGYFLFLLLIGYPPRWRWMPRFWLVAMLLGMIVMMVVGVADFFGAVDLRFWRPLDANVNPGNVMQRLQSFFGHSSWIAQYITVAVPSILILLTVDWRRKIIVGLILTILIFGELVLILAYQRAGWVSYPLTLVVVWFSIYVLDHAQGGVSVLTSIRRSLLKISLSVPLTLLTSMLLFIVITGELPHKYLDRFKQISTVGDRALYLPVTLQLAALHPVLGGGVGSFAYRYVEAYLLPSGLHSQEGNPLRIYFNNAHSTYLQVLAGQGYVGLMIYLGFLFSALIMPLQWVFRGFDLPESAGALIYYRRILLLAGLCSTIAFSLYGIVDDLFYIPAPSVILFLTLGIMVSEIPPLMRLSRDQLRFISKMFLLLIAMHLFWEYGYPGDTRRLIAPPSAEGCYDVELQRDGSNGRICASRFTLDVPVFRAENQTYAAVKLTPMGKYGDLDRSIITARNPEGPEVEVRLQNGLPAWIVYPVERSASETISLEFRTSNGFLPVRDPRQLSLDRREMAVTMTWPLVSPLDIAKIEARCAEAAPGEGEWLVVSCGSGGTLGAGFFSDKESTYGLRVEDPTTSNENPIWVWIGSSDRKVRLIRFADDEWHSFSELGISLNQRPTWVEVSRAYSPMIEGRSNDARLYAFQLRRH